MKNLIFITSLLPYLAFSQVKTYVSTDPVYIRNVDAADALFMADSYREAIPFYLKALEISEEAYRTKNRLAFCYLLEHEYASANQWLLKCAKQDPSDFCVHHVFEKLAPFQKYRPFIEWKPLVYACYDGLPKYSPELMQVLAEIRHFDQFIRTEHRLPNEADCAGNPYYWPGMSFRQVDSVNEVRVAAIIEQVGEYPGLGVVGELQKNTTWLVIQHAPIDFQERYYPFVEKAADEGQVSMGDWAYLVDRMNMNRGQKQVYGSQMRQKSDDSSYEIYPLEDPYHVNERRASVGLGPIEDYIQHWGIKFEPEKME